MQSMEFSGPEYWSEQPFPSLGDLPNPEIEPRSPALQADSLPAEPEGKPLKVEVPPNSVLVPLIYPLWATLLFPLFNHLLYADDSLIFIPIPSLFPKLHVIF